MNLNRANSFQLDWLLVFIYVGLVVFGYFNIVSAATGAEFTSYFDVSKPYGKQLIFIGAAFISIVFILAVDAKFYERFASIIFLFSMSTLIGLFLFGKNINGALSWYDIGGFTLQPSEFAKFATALALAKYMSSRTFKFRDLQDKIKMGLLLGLPILLILLQNDTGSMLAYTAFFLMFYREGMSGWILVVGVSAAVLFILALLVSVEVIVGLTLIVIAIVIANYISDYKRI